MRLEIGSSSYNRLSIQYKVVGLIIRPGDALVEWILFFAFVSKYLAPAWVDYEAYFHWDMHCRVLELRDSRLFLLQVGAG